MFGKYIKNNKAFAIYDEIAKTLTFHKNSSIPNVGDIYAYTDDNGKLVKKQVTKVYKNIENLVCKYYWVVPWKHYREKIVYVEVVDKMSPVDTSHWFFDFCNCKDFKLNKLDMSNVINMQQMFEIAGKNVSKFNLDLSNWDVSNVVDMSYMFNAAGFNATTFCLDLSNWNTSKTKNMASMFAYAGETAKDWNIKGLEVWNVSNVRIMDYTFANTGYKATYSLDLSS